MSKKNRRAVPEYHRPIIETHFHLDYLKEAPADTILAEARAIGVERFMTISVQPDNMPTALALALAHDDVYATLGVHPHEAALFDDATVSYMRDHAANHKVVAVGEIGLDYYYDHCDRSVQRQVFCRQLELAIEFDQPVVIHTREADADSMAILQEYAPQMRRKGVIHSFTSGLELGQLAVELGFNLGINGIVTFNKAVNVREVVAATPLERLLLETDSPYLTPMPYRGIENAPKYLPFVAEKIADVKGLPVETVLGQTWQNAMATFFPAELS
ncbi:MULTISPECIES: TatD family hydrolase [unclassified Oceanobacter]|uniref:TatD family hydrolase n=2 Tax=Gammaproteobacteria TaxID=1236 RepID=UPI002734AF0B|nr:MULTISPECIES: TatD family hydrolase [unclassified Oceanobacter]MDP2608143.1 TatD family hydrolase [Oceanobacter sp. 1_MG-2023]MDP2611195.1 TatD family hydrolase [Oceanobacter sp. 2_MG-2023]